MSTTLRDSYGRKIEYLRISITDRCNFRCLYCMPVAGLEWLPKSEILSYEEIARVVGELAQLGLRRLRITGGELQQTMDRHGYARWQGFWIRKDSDMLVR